MTEMVLSKCGYCQTLDFFAVGLSVYMCKKCGREIEVELPYDYVNTAVPKKSLKKNLTRYHAVVPNIEYEDIITAKTIIRFLDSIEQLKNLDFTYLKNKINGVKTETTINRYFTDAVTTTMVSSNKSVETYQGADGVKYIAIIPKKVVAIKHKSDGTYYRAEAKCGKKDAFNLRVGVDICNLRLKKLELKDELAKTLLNEKRMFFLLEEEKLKSAETITAIDKIEKELEKYL
jgi:hypothetical protein